MNEEEKVVKGFKEVLNKFMPEFEYLNQLIESFELVHKNKLLDKNFVSRCVDENTLKDRLAEIILAKKCYAIFGDDVSSKNKGPDITIKFEGKVINIECIRPNKEALKKTGNFTVFDFSPDKRENVTYTVQDEYVDTPEFCLHIGGRVLTKTKKYQEYLDKGTIKKTDINIVCVNIGFNEKIDSILISELKRLFYGMPFICLESDSENNVGTKIKAHIEDRPCTYYKDFDVGKPIETATFSIGNDSDFYRIIDGVIILNKNNTHELGCQISNDEVIFVNLNGKGIPDEFIKRMGLKTGREIDPEDYTITKVRECGYM
ncbi:hypothetical protein [Phytobacter sp. RSE-02]|uniref:hypothetical protein n=1 Tax=Phytobacter sp. RSE-02 TaxID=3229229 RepID=UPI00339D3BAC